MRTNSEPPSLVVPFAKRRGKTSFASLSVIKRALGTTKVGHTGTLDSFADGLLVVLTGRLTRLVPHITSFDKTYLALVRFGTETDTLDPTGAVVRTGAIPARAQVEAVLPQFVGTIAQVPPLYSAIHLDGSRASDLARAGKTAVIPARNVTIYGITLLDMAGECALVEVRCSKGTYIRALARDIAAACGTCAHLAALRRTRVGPFSLADAAGADDLDDFTIAALTDTPSDGADDPVRDAATFYPRIRAAARGMDAALAECCGFIPAELTFTGANAYANGRPLKKSCLYYPAGRPLGARASLAVFYPGADGEPPPFGGVAEKAGGRLSYGFVIPREASFPVFSWEQVAEGRFPAAWREQGVALTVGSFDGPHLGHEALFRTVLAQTRLVPGVLVFARPPRAVRQPEGYAGDVATLAQKLAHIARCGFAFAVVVDFTAAFAALPGEAFLAALADGCGMRFLAEGEGFRCGHAGATDMAHVRSVGRERGFAVAAVAPVRSAGERVSSSRVRDAVRGGDMAAANALLGHPFALDCAGWEWRQDGSALCVRTAGVQVLPARGNYDVTVQCARGAVDAVCTVGAGTLTLRGADGVAGLCIRAVAFR